MTIPQHYSGIGQNFLLLIYRSTVWNTTNTKAIYAFQCSMPFCFIKPNHTYNYPVATLLSDLKGTCAGFASFYPLGCKYHDPNRKCYLTSTKSIEICLRPLRLNNTPKMSRVSKNSNGPELVPPQGSDVEDEAAPRPPPMLVPWRQLCRSGKDTIGFFFTTWDRPSYKLLYVAKV
jgi:hypothetical protein